MKKLDELHTKASISKKIQATGKRRRVNPYGQIVTSDKQFEDPVKSTDEKERKETKKLRQKKGDTTEKDDFIINNSKSNEKNGEETDAQENKEESLSNDEEPMASEDDYDSDLHYYDEDTKSHFPPQSERQSYLYIRKVWEEINPPASENEIVGRFFASIYYPDVASIIRKVISVLIED